MRQAAEHNKPEAAARHRTTAALDRGVTGAPVGHYAHATELAKKVVPCAADRSARRHTRFVARVTAQTARGWWSRCCGDQRSTVTDGEPLWTIELTSSISMGLHFPTGAMGERFHMPRSIEAGDAAGRQRSPSPNRDCHAALPTGHHGWRLAIWAKCFSAFRCFKAFLGIRCPLMQTFETSMPISPAALYLIAIQTLAPRVRDKLSQTGMATKRA